MSSWNPDIEGIAAVLGDPTLRGLRANPQKSRHRHGRGKRISKLRHFSIGSDGHAQHLV